MKQSAVDLENIGVCYRLYKERVFSLKETLIGGIKKSFLQLVGKNQNTEPQHTPFWALKQITTHIRKGSSTALYGRNGSGKSTLLKVISGVIHPTEGKLFTRGRIAALVELGAGFDPELTGRENIHFANSLLGLSRKESEYKVQSIIDFSELHQFIDVPVKNYSSGMYARLGFAVATDSNPDILIIDEILAVGDAEFQVKCFERMFKFRKLNKTILFVSHDQNQIQKFCDEQIELVQGQIVSETRSP
jgi:ABC-type polysaccharide/polyol phosphate transport system ATPase subunit